MNDHRATKQCVLCKKHKPTREIYWGVCGDCLEHKMEEAAERHQEIRDAAIRLSEEK